MVYDVAGNRTNLVISASGGYNISFTYDSLSRMTEVKGSTGLIQAAYSYDDLSRRTGVGFINSTAQGTTYEPDGALDTLTLDIAGTASDASWSFNYNRVNQVTSRSVSATTYAWAGISKPTRACTVNGLNQYSSVAGLTVANDTNGNLGSWNGWTNSYDPENRLISATNAGSGVSATYAYDAMARSIIRRYYNPLFSW